MSRNRNETPTAPDSVISIIAVGMKVTGDCATDGTLRIEGSVQGTVRAGKAIVIGKEGMVDGHVITQDAMIAGTVTGTVTAQSRLEVQSTARIDGEVAARRMQLEEGAVLNGKVTMGESVSKSQSPGGHASAVPETAAPIA